MTSDRTPKKLPNQKWLFWRSFPSTPRLQRDRPYSQLADSQASPDLEKVKPSSKIDSFDEDATFRSALTSAQDPKISTINYRCHRCQFRPKFEILFHQGVSTLIRVALITALIILNGCLGSRQNHTVFAVRIMDSKNGRGIPMVELKTLNAISAYSDNDGWVSIDDTDLMGSKHYFEIHSPGYQYPKDSLGREAVVLMVIGGGDTTITMDRQNMAERLYRVTGMGKQIHFQRLRGRLTNGRSRGGGVLGQDSNLAIPYQGKILWVWGDTFLPGAYEGNFSVSAAWSTDPRTETWAAEDGIPLDYITNDQGFSRPMIHLEGPGYVWFDWLMTIPDANSQQILVAKYARVNALFGNYERGLARFNDEKQLFEKIQEIEAWKDQGHSTQHPALIEIQDSKYYYIFDEFSFSRVNAQWEDVVNPESYEYFHCVKEVVSNGSSFTNPDRGSRGDIVYSWRKNILPFTNQQQKRLIQSGYITSSEGLIQIRDVVTGDLVDPGRGSIAFNTFRNRWVCIWGKQDIWYAEADTPVGPWVYAKKVATHDHFYYNPVHHPFLDEEGGQRIYFEGTFTKFFSAEPPIPRYEYNQLLYGLSLVDEDLALPVPVYLLKQNNREIFVLRGETHNRVEDIVKIPFFALDRNVDDLSIIPIYADSTGQLQITSDNSEVATFYAVDPNYDLSENYLGQWEGKIHFKSFENFFQFQLLEERGTWKIISSRPTFQFYDLQVKKLSFEVKLTHEGDNYELQGQMRAGKIHGTFQNLKSKSSGEWHAKHLEHRWWSSESPDLVPLYAYTSQDGSLKYSIQPADDTKKWIFCKVWQNPMDIMTFDFEARPK